MAVSGKGVVEPVTTPTSHVLLDMKLLALLTVSLLCAVSSGLYADRAGEVDWYGLTNSLLQYLDVCVVLYRPRYRQYVGHVTWMRFEQVPGSRRKVLVANRDTLAALSASSGAVGR